MVLKSSHIIQTHIDQPFGQMDKGGSHSLFAKSGRYFGELSLTFRNPNFLKF